MDTQQKKYSAWPLFYLILFTPAGLFADGPGLQNDSKISDNPKIHTTFKKSIDRSKIRQAKAVNLGTAASFGSFGGGAGMSNQGVFSVINGNIGTTAEASLMTGWHDKNGLVYTQTPLNVGKVNGMVYTSNGDDPGVIATVCALDARSAYTKLAILQGGIDPSVYGGEPGQLANRILPSGIYKAFPGAFLLTGGDLTLDAQGNPNAVWVFQMKSSLTVGEANGGRPSSVHLINGALAKNVFWQVGSAATINGSGGGVMVGTIIAEDGATFSTPGNNDIVILNGRALGLNASVTMVNTVVNIPGA